MLERLQKKQNVRKKEQKLILAPYVERQKRKTFQQLVIRTNRLKTRKLQPVKKLDIPEILIAQTVEKNLYRDKQFLQLVTHGIMELLQKKQQQKQQGLKHMLVYLVEKQKQ